MRHLVGTATGRRSGAFLPRVIGCMITAVIVFMTVAPAVIYAENDKDKNQDDDPVTFLPPLGNGFASGDFDESLVEYLTVSVYQKIDQEWVLIQEYTSELSGSERLRLAGNHYQVNWHEVLGLGDSASGKANAPGQSKEPGEAAEGKGGALSGEYRIVVSVAGLEVGNIDVVAGGNHDTSTEGAAAGPEAENIDVVAAGDSDTSTEGVIVNERGSIPIKIAVDNSAEIRARVLTEQGYGASDIARMLRAEFDLVAAETAQLLVNEGHSAQAIGLALKDVYNLDAEDCAQILKAVGFAAEATAAVMAGVYARSAFQTAQIMSSIGYHMAEIHNGLKAVWASLTTGDILQFFKDLSYTADEVILFLHYGLQWTVAQVLEGIAVFNDWVNEAADWLYYGLQWTEAQIIAGLAAAGFLMVDIAGWLRDGLAWTGDQIIAGLKAAGYFMGDIAQWLGDGLSWTGEQIIAGLTQAGYALQEVGLYFYSALNWTAEAFADALDALGYAAEAIVNVMTDIWDVTQDVAKTILEGLGYAVDFIDDLFESIFGTVICTELYRQGYLSDELYAADVEFGRWIEKHLPQVLKGYQFLAAPIVSQMQQSKSFTNSVWFFAKPWSEEMAYMTGVSDRENFGGALIMVVGIPLCFIVGVFVTLGYPSLAGLILSLGIAYAYRRGYLPALNISHRRFNGDLRLNKGYTQAPSLIAVAS